MQIQTILVIPFADGIGDFVNMEPLLRGIRRRWPDAEVSVAVSPHGAALNGDPSVRLIHPSSLGHKLSPWEVRLRPLLPQQVLAWAAGPLLEQQWGPFDLVLNLFFAWERALDFPRTWTPQWPPQPSAVHTLDCLADELEHELGIRLPLHERQPRLALRPAAVEAATTAWTEAGLGADSGPVVALVPVSNMAIKRWPAAHWLALDHALRAAHPGLQTLLFCDTPVADNRWARAFAGVHSPALPIYRPLDEVAALLARCDLVIGVDTGLLHIGATLGVPWLGLFGPTNPAVTGPYNTRRGRALVAPFTKPASCNACWKHFKYEADSCRTLAEGSCMHALPVEWAAGAALAALGLPGPYVVPVPTPLRARPLPAEAWGAPAPNPLSAS